MTVTVISSVYRPGHAERGVVVSSIVGNETPVSTVDKAPILLVNIGTGCAHQVLNATDLRWPADAFWR